MRILITGAAGFIGSHVVDAALAAGHDVCGLDSLGATTHDAWPDYWPDSAKLIVGDIRDAALLDRVLEGVDVVCHQAAVVGHGTGLPDLPVYSDVNVTGTAVLLEAMGQRRVPRLVLASSMVVYGEGGYACPAHARVRPLGRSRDDLARGKFDPRCPRCGAELRTVPVTEDAPLDPRTAYAVSKVAQEQMAAVWAALTGGSAVALRYHNVYGPRMPRDTPYSGVAAIFRSALEAGLAPRVFEDGAQQRDFIHAEDVAAANLLAMNAGRPGQLRAYNIASGDPHTIGQMAAALAGFLGGPKPTVTGEFRPGDVRHIVASPVRARSELGFLARIGFDAGIAQFARAPLRAPARAARAPARAARSGLSVRRPPAQPPAAA